MKPAPPTLARLAGIPAAGMVVVWALLAAVWLLTGAGAWGPGVLAGGVAVAGALLVSVPVVMSGASAGPRRGPIRLLVAGVVRLIVALALALLAVGVGKYPPVPTFLTLIPLYMVVMALETRQILTTRWDAAP